MDRYDHEVPVQKILEISSVITAFEITYNDHFYYPGETHDFWEFVSVLDGEINVTADDKVLHLHKNQIIFHKPMEFHRLWSSNMTTPHLIILSFKTAIPFYLKECVFNMEEEEVSQLRNLIQISREVFAFQDICAVALQPGKRIDYQLFINSLERFVLQIIKSHAVSDARNTSSSAQNYARIINTLYANLDRQLTLAQIAELTHMSESNVKRIFTCYADVGIIKYFHQLQIQKAILLLRSGSTVAETAARLGFREPCYFSTVFKRITGYSPKNYLRQYPTFDRTLIERSIGSS